jgi:hypothetical protein
MSWAHYCSVSDDEQQSMVSARHSHWSIVDFLCPSCATQRACRHAQLSSLETLRARATPTARQ